MSTVTVGGGSIYTTLQEGIAAAEATHSNSIVIAAGTYNGNAVLTSADNGISISAAGPGVTLNGSIGITNASGISFTGLTFSGNGANVAITALGSESLSFTSNVFTGTGQAIVLDGSSNNSILANVMLNTTNSAVEARNGANSNTISSNVIDGGSAVGTIGAIYLHGASNNAITHNQISNTTGAAISLSDFFGPGTTGTQNNNNTVAYNSLNHVDTKGSDSGAIYLLGRSQNPMTGNVIQSNYIGTTGSAGAHAVGIYLDDNTSGVLVKQNIIQATSTMSDVWEIHGGSNNTFSGNIFDITAGNTDYGLSQVDEADQAPVGTFTQLVNDVITGNIYATESEAPHDPAFADLTSDQNGALLSGVWIHNNNYWAFSGAGLNVLGSGAQGDTAPAYVKPADRPAATLADYGNWTAPGIGFQPIDTSKIGLDPNAVTVPEPVSATLFPVLAAGLVASRLRRRVKRGK
jgi:hypothetical protein